MVFPLVVLIALLRVDDTVYVFVCACADVSPTSQALCDDVVTVLTVFCEKLELVER